MQEWDHQQPRRAWPKSFQAQVGKMCVAVGQGDVKFRAPGVRSLRGFTRLELQERLSKQCVIKQDYKNPLPIKEAITATPDCGEWEVPPARPTAPGRKTYRRGSLRIINHLSGNSGEVECEVDKFAKSVVESVRPRLSWRMCEGTQDFSLPSDRGASAAPGNSVETSWL